jgi:hypothetical protein
VLEYETARLHELHHHGHTWVYVCESATSRSPCTGEVHQTYLKGTNSSEVGRVYNNTERPELHANYSCGFSKLRNDGHLQPHRPLQIYVATLRIIKP